MFITLLKLIKGEIMNKKSIYLIVGIISTIIVTLTAGWVIFSSLNADFSFEGLSLNLNSISQIGVYKNSATPLGRKRANGGSSGVNQNESYLVGYNNAGEQTPLIYLNDENQEVRVPYSVFSFEVVGDFSYIVYYNSQAEGVLSGLENDITRSWELRPLGSTQFEILLKKNSGSWDAIKGTQAYIILHNESGKLFDAVKTMGLEPYESAYSAKTSVGLRLFTPLKNRIFYFAERGNVCKGELEFNEFDNTLTKIEVCSPLNIMPIFVHESGYFVYTFDNKVSFASPDFSITGDLTSYFLSGIPERNTVFKSVGENIIMISGNTFKKFVVFDGNFLLIEEKNEIFEFGNFSGFPTWLFNKDGFDYFTNYSIIYYINFENFIFGSLIDEESEFSKLPQFFFRFVYIVFEGNLYEIGRNIRQLNEDKTFSVLEQNITYVLNDIPSMIKTGYVEYTQTQGLTQINKSLNLQTGEIYLQSESRPTITVTQVQPIN